MSMATPVSQTDELNRIDTATPQPARIPGQPGRFAQAEPLLFGIIAIVVVVGAWQIVASLRLVTETFLPGPSDVFTALVNQISDGSLWYNLWVSAQEFLIGYGLAVAVGLVLGMLMSWYRRFRLGLDPLVSFLYATPRIALTPLFIIWFGIGMESKVAVVFLSAVFPVIINTMAGVRSVDPSLIKASRSFGASDLQLFRTVALPGSVPFILTGLRLAVGYALIGVVVGEFVAAQAGIGFLMANAGSTFQTPLVFADLFVVAGSGLLLTAFLQRIERRFQSWRPRS